MNMKQILNHTALTKAKISVLTGAITALICSSVGASDIDIYKAPATGAGATTILFMLDKSGSMNFTDYPNITYDRQDCPSRNNDAGGFSYKKAGSYVTHTFGASDWYGTKTLSYRECIRGTSSWGFWSGWTFDTEIDRKATRLTQLKIGLLQLLLGDKSDSANIIEPLSSDLYIGLAVFSGSKGTRIEEVKKLDPTHRQNLVQKIIDLTATGGTPTPYAYAEAGAILMGTKTGGGDYSNSSTNYSKPVSIAAQTTDTAKQCSAQGIYFLTDGRPEPGGTAPGSNGKSGDAYKVMKSALDTKGSLFDCKATATSVLGRLSSYYRDQHAWNCTGKFNQALLDPEKNPIGIKIRTAVVGFGRDFDTGATDPSDDVKDAKSWGELGEGGSYSGLDSKAIVESFEKFLTIVKTDIPGISTGNATLPIDALNSNAIQPYGYFPQFVPKVATTELQRTWYGNLKKYHAVLGSLYGNRSGSYPGTITGSNPVMQNNEIKNVADLWKNSAYVTTSNETAFQGGALSNLVQGYVADRSPKERLLLTDFSYQNGKVSQNLNLSWYDDSEKKTKFNAITTAYNLNSSAPYRAALMGLLGYENAVAGEDLTTKPITGKLPQIGAILHSKPVLLTQSGLPTVTGTSASATIDTTNRDDYILFGSTQGVLHVLDAKNDKGNEVFAFIPKEMIELQNQGFLLNGGADTGGKNKLYYGIDGEWTAHTVYVSDSNGKLTVDGGSRTIQNDAGKDETINLKGKQWVYGGLRMGGRSYYSLDLTDMSSPKVKFHIDPNNKQVHYLDGSVTKSKTIDELKYMGQSWSKPTLAYVNWFGKRKLVMIVGGGYDAGSTTGMDADGDGEYTTTTVAGKLVKVKRNGYAGYENANYDQINKIGAGVYMFDADNGDLLWSVSGNNASTTTTGTKNLKLAGNSSNVNMNYSIVSEIKTVDRNNDGLIDHLYFGDLRGQAFRVDFSPSTSGFKSQVNRILDLSATRKRFYNAPTFTIHSEGTAVVSFASGNKSQPLHGHATPVSGVDDFDGVFAIYDYDVYSDKYPTSAFVTRTLGANSATAISQLKLLDKRVDNNDSPTNIKRPKIDSSSGNGGWYYLFNKEEALSATGTAETSTKNKQILKSLGSLVAMESDLYVPVFDSSKPGTTGSCSAGVAGETALQRFCLPYGICKTNIYIPLGAGIGEPIIGGGRDGDPNKRSIFVLNEDKKDGVTGSGSGQIKNYGGALKLIPNRWYEQYAQGGG
ncbi:hypothetical protein [Acinetobacter indicus]|uniref:hypothetical protein n=1 Tax=Acinetobacter indicus TaxID=756892 RepID=UPI00209A978D|nr:hypothetical protein [Acinetobacter indicus]MCO8098611.1 hypothetical protein [Acinetobacter indicus]MCO8104214.1 hypothetical protein [Acinetobacter indicus]MCO8109889.1 hypothetical protein [Acinetobacter indicus]